MTTPQRDEGMTMTTFTMTKLYRAMLNNQGMRLTENGPKLSAVTEENLGLACWFAVDHMMADEIMGAASLDWFATRMFSDLCALMPHLSKDYIKGEIMKYRAGVEDGSELETLNEGYRFRARVTRALDRMRAARRQAA